VARSPLAWPGGKSKSAAKIVKLMPEHEVYVEPFAGGASVFFRKAPAKKSVLADVNRNLVRFFGLGRKQGAFRSCRATGRKQFEEISRKYKAGKLVTPCEFLILNKGSFSANMRDYDHHGMRNKGVVSNVIARHPQWAGLLRRARITQRSFEQVMKEHDGPETLHYLDPPYDIAERDNVSAYGKHGKGVSPQKVFDVARRMKGKVMISYNYTDEVDRLFCKKGSGFRCHRIGTRYSFGTTKKRADLQHRKAQDLLITNFDPRTGKRLGRSGSVKRRRGRKGK